MFSASVDKSTLWELIFEEDYEAFYNLVLSLQAFRQSSQIVEQDVSLDDSDIYVEEFKEAIQDTEYQNVFLDLKDPYVTLRLGTFSHPTCHVSIDEIKM